MAEPFRLRITFAKTDRLRWLSHLELTRTMERLIRRSGLPYVVTQGFNRHMRFAVGPALPVGTAGWNEVFDVWLTDYVPPGQALAALQSAAGDTLPIKAVRYVPGKVKGLQSTHTISRYRLLVDAGGMTGSALQEALNATISTGQIEVWHKGKTRVFDLDGVVVRPPEVLPMDPSEGYLSVTCVLRSLERGSIRPEQLMVGPSSESVRVVAVIRTALEEEQSSEEEE